MVVNTLDKTFAALSDPTRRAMIERLSQGPASVHGLTESFVLSQKVSDWAMSYRRFWEESFDKLDVVLNQMKMAEAKDDTKRRE
jgi:DNA-binding transcriptional ArsR family regulator